MKTSDTYANIDVRKTLTDVGAMAVEYRICKFCHESSAIYEDGIRRLYKYGVRHYAHATCLLIERGESTFDLLPEHEVRSFPVLIAADFRMLRAMYAKLGIAWDDMAERIQQAADEKQGQRLHGKPNDERAIPHDSPADPDRPDAWRDSGHGAEDSDDDEGDY